MDERSVEMIIEHFGLPPGVELSGPVDRGYQGEVWRLDDHDHAYAVKVALVGLSEAQARRAYGFQERAGVLGVAAPRQHLGPGDAIMLESAAGGIRIFDWVDLAGPDRDLESSSVGELLARLHRSGGPVDERLDPWYTDPVTETRWRTLVDALVRRDGPYGAELESLIPRLVDLERWLITPEPPYTLGHRDLWADNVRAWAGPGLMVIDWDNCGAVDSSQELAMVLAEFGTDPQRVADLYQAYRASGGPGRITRPEDFSATIATLSHILEAGLVGWLNATTDADRTLAQGRIQEWVEAPLLPEHVRSLVEQANQS